MTMAYETTAVQAFSCLPHSHLLFSFLFMPPKRRRAYFCQGTVCYTRKSDLHSAGYGKFKQHICPDAKPGAVHSFPIDSVAIYQMFGPVETGSRRIKSINDALGNKRQVFQSIFNLDRINSLCTQHGLRSRSYHLRSFGHRCNHWVLSPRKEPGSVDLRRTERAS
ncbi:uncharacterized protein BYT42DRAFT_144254 [Radiomyces spectabilis]|uniref:uncharacterized protein n=1 Tax=Radiomyces spectabilis TaxID=64574 RepID=UPI00221E8947|nr:uncharacterized protein BYT42DRAFT_144254 [Radiomyces spectabilis]KAI8366825.1 hypothetical protein BYT42DRAFT_144254 [Radiomyces spectabilis]